MSLASLSDTKAPCSLVGRFGLSPFPPSVPLNEIKRNRALKKLKDRKVDTSRSCSSVGTSADAFVGASGDHLVSQDHSADVSITSVYVFSDDSSQSLVAQVDSDDSSQSLIAHVDSDDSSQSQVVQVDADDYHTPDNKPDSSTCPRPPIPARFRTDSPIGSPYPRRRLVWG